jgi:1-acyl-sn-glycerol-3-phosphate acyltransferase
MKLDDVGAARPLVGLNSSRREPVYTIARGVLYLPLRFGIRWKLENVERVPTAGPAVIATNHVSFVDTLAMLWLGDLRQRRVRFVTKAELWGVRGMGFVLDHTHMIPVQRDSAGAAAAIEPTVEALRAGECVQLFPEGRISPDLEPMSGKTGAARIAARSGVPVTPVGVWGGQRLYTLGRKPRWRTGVAISVVVGEAVGVDPDEDIYDATDRIMGAIAACVSRARQIYPQGPKKGEGDWWVRSPDTAAIRPARRHPGPPSRG